MSGPSISNRIKLYSCILDYKKLTSISAFEYTNSDKNICPKLQYAIDHYFIDAFTSSGNVHINIINNLLYGGILRGKSLIPQMHKINSKLVMNELAIDIIQNKIPTHKIEEYLSTKKQYYNPFTKKPFNWDNETNRIYSHHPKDKTIEYSFYLPNKKRLSGIPD